MTPEEIKQVVEDYRKSSQTLNELKIKIGNIEFDTRNLGRQDRDKVIKNNDNKNNSNGAQGATNGAQGAQSSTTTGAQGAQSNDSVGAQGAQSSTTTGAQGAQSNDSVGAQSSTVTGAQGAQSSTVTGAQGAQSSTVTGAQGAQTNTIKKNEIDQYIRKGKEVTINDFGGIKPSNPSGKVIPKPTKPLMTNSPAAKAGIPIEMRQKFADQNAAFQATKNKDSGYTKMDFIKDFPKSQTAKKYNKGENIPGFSYKKNLNNSYEPYHIVLGYVLSEGHADTVEEAHYIMTQMDGETIQEIVALDEMGAASKIATGAALTLGGLGLNAIRKMMQNKDKMDKGGKFTPGSTMDNIQKKNKMLDDLKSGNY